MLRNYINFVKIAIVGGIIVGATSRLPVDERYQSPAHPSDQSHKNYAFYQQHSDFCPKLLNQIPKCEKIANSVQNFTEYLFERGIVVDNSQPAFGFFNGLPLDDVLAQKCLKAEVALHLSAYIRDEFFDKSNTRFCNLIPFLKQHSKCLRSYFSDVDELQDRAYVMIKHPQYQPIDGFGVNMEEPKQGATDTPFGTMFFPVYNDGIEEMRKSVRSNHELPAPRLLSELLQKSTFSTRDVDVEVNLGAVMFGQLITHDTSLRAHPQRVDGGPGIRCCSADGKTVLPPEKSHPFCEPIVSKKGECMNFLRSQSALDNDCLLSPRLQLNRASSLPDLSPIYGNTRDMMERVRGENGLLKLGEHGIFSQDDDGVFILPDIRARQTPILATVHAIFNREHNRIARELKYLHPDWTSDQVFYEARRWNIAQYHFIIWNEWLPLFISDTTKRLIDSRSTDVSTTNEFTHSAFRMFHLNLPESFNSYSQNGEINRSMKLSDSIGKIKFLEKEFDDVIRSYFYQNAAQNGPLEEITEFLFKNDQHRGIDLISFDVLRSRDHGVAPYYIFVYECHGIKLRHFTDLTKHGLMSLENVRKLQWTYETIYDVDLYVGGALEITHTDFFGPTITCILNEQFERWKNGNPYFYGNTINPNPFLPEQLEALNNVTFARLLVDNTNLKLLPRATFLSFSPSKNPLVSCDEIPTVTLY